MEDLRLITTKEGVDDLVAYLKDKEYIAVDTETTGIQKDSSIIGLSFAAELDKSFYVVTKSWNKNAQALESHEPLDYIQSILKALVGKKLIMHNAVFDVVMIKNNYGVDLMRYLHTDTMILAHMLNENRHNGLKELGTVLFGDNTRDEQIAMKESVHRNGGVLTKEKYELYKADWELIGKYGAKDTLLTIKLFYTFIEELYEQGLDLFFYEDESMPLLKGPTYELNTTGLRVDPGKLEILKGTLQADCLEAKGYIYSEINHHVSTKFKGSNKANTFNIGASKQLAWLLYFQLGNEFNNLTKGGKELCKALDYKIPYSPVAKRDFIRMCIENKGRVYEEAKFNPKTKKLGRPKKVGDPWNYIACGKESLKKYSKKYKWVEKLLEYAKNLKLLNTYVEGIQSRMRYNVINPSFLQHGTTSGRYSSKNPNFQNLPRDDKRIKACIVSRPGKLFIGADYSQLEPRVFASFSKDERLLACFKNGEDFYSVIGAEVFDKVGYSLKKNEENSFAKKFPQLRDISKAVALSVTYGTTAHKLAPLIGKGTDEAQEVIDSYFEKFPSVQDMMLSAHKTAKEQGRVTNLFGRPRRMPAAKDIAKLYGNTSHSELPYEVRNILNLAVNHTIQSTGASIMNRAAIAVWQTFQELSKNDSIWKEVKIVMQVHDELILEAPESIAEEVKAILKYCMENTVTLPGVDLIADPKIANNLADLK